MAVIARLSRLFKADFHAVLDQIEEPEVLLRQSIREMQDHLGETERRTRHGALELETLRTRLTDINGALNEFDGELDVCFESGNDALARNLIRRKLETQRAKKRLDEKISQLQRFLDEQRNHLAENRATLESLQQKAELFAERADGDDLSGWSSRSHDEIHGAGRINDTDVEVAFLREKQRRALA